MGPSGQLTISGMQLGGQMAQDTNSSTLVVKITQAIGGTIVNISGQYDNHLAEIYVIPDGNNFDTELGKIITHARLKRG